MIKPTVGRVVWFWPSIASGANGVGIPFNYNGASLQPCAAQIAYVREDGLVNISVTDHKGIQHPMCGVPLVQGEVPKPKDGFYCEWMPYQKQVAAGEIKPTLHATTPVAPHAAAPCVPPGEFGMVTVGGDGASEPPSLPDFALKPEYRPVPRLHENDIAATIVSEQFHVFADTRVTVCCLTLRNGFAVIGQSACASGMAWDAQRGREIALYDAKRKIWELEGYLLRERLQSTAASRM